jgi:hypothetical protein
MIQIHIHLIIQSDLGSKDAELKKRYLQVASSYTTELSTCDCASL